MSILSHDRCQEGLQKRRTETVPCGGVQEVGKKIAVLKLSAFDAKNLENIERTQPFVDSTNELDISLDSPERDSNLRE